MLSNPTLRALLAACLFVYIGQNMLNASIAPLSRALGLAEWIVGLAISCAALFVTVLSRFWGRRSVAWGRRRVMLASLGLALIAGTLFALAVALRSAGVLGAGAAAAVIVLARGPFFGSAVSAIPPTGQTLIAEITPDERSRVAGMSAFSGAIQLSIVVGSLLSSLLGSWSILAPVWATPVCVALAFIIGWVGIPREEPRPSPHRGGDHSGLRGTSPLTCPTSRSACRTGRPVQRRRRATTGRRRHRRRADRATTVCAGCCDVSGRRWQFCVRTLVTLGVGGVGGHVRGDGFGLGVCSVRALAV
nr:MFS transporter [Actinomyces respiraculi]